MDYKFRKADGQAVGTKGWSASHKSNSSTAFTGLWLGNNVVALLVSKDEDSDEDFDDMTKRLQVNGDTMVRALNTQPALLEYFNASVAFNNAHGEGPEDETLAEAVERERKAEARFDAAIVAVRAALAAAGAA